MSRSDLSSDTPLVTTLAGLTRLLVLILLAPGIMAGALIAGGLAICLTPVLLLGWPAHWSSGSWLPRLSPMRGNASASR